MAIWSTKPILVLHTSEVQNFNAKMVECIDRALASLGAGVREALYYHIRQSYDLPKVEFQKRCDEFVLDLEKTLGKTGFHVVERLTISEMRSSFGLEFSEQLTLPQAIRKAKGHFLS